jgi:hypothetical protein
MSLGRGIVSRQPPTVLQYRRLLRLLWCRRLMLQRPLMHRNMQPQG